MTARLNLLLLAMIVISSLALISSQHQARKLYNELQVELASAKRFEEEMGRLQIEQSFWSTYAYVENVASTKLQMRIPSSNEVEIPAP
jgi:cell division protein FtsL